MLFRINRRVTSSPAHYSLVVWSWTTSENLRESKEALQPKNTTRARRSERAREELKFQEWITWTQAPKAENEIQLIDTVKSKVFSGVNNIIRFFFFRLFSFLWAVLRRPDLCSPSSFIDFYTFVHWKRFFSRARLSTSECLFTQTHKRRLRLPKHTQPSLAPLLPRPLRRFDSATISAKSKSKCRLNKTYSRAGERKKIVVEIFINYSGSDEAKGKLMN